MVRSRMYLARNGVVIGGQYAAYGFCNAAHRLRVAASFNNQFPRSFPFSAHIYRKMETSAENDPHFSLILTPFLRFVPSRSPIIKQALTSYQFIIGKERVPTGPWTSWKSQKRAPPILIWERSVPSVPHNNLPN